MSYRRLRQTILIVLGLVMVLAAVSYSNLLQRGYVVIKFSALLTGATALLALCSFLVFTGKRWKELQDPLFYLLAGEAGVLILSIAFSGQPMVSLLGSMPRLMGSVTIFCFLVAAVAVVLGAGRRRENLLYLLRVLAATSIAVSLNAIYEWPTHPIFRPPGLVGNAEFLSNYLLFGALGSLGLLLTEKRRGWWIFGLVATALIGVGMSVLQTRGAWLGYGAGIMAFLLFVRPWKMEAALVKQSLQRLLLLLPTAFVFAGIAALYGVAAAIRPMSWHALLPFLPVFGMAFLPLPFLLPRLKVVRYALVGTIVVVTAITGYSVTTQTSILPYKVGSALRVTQESARGIVREDTVSMLKKHWLFGCGIENYRVAFLQFKSERVARADPRVNYRNPHNMLLYEWTANGLFGVLVYVGLIVVGIWSLILARRKEEETRWGLLAAGLLAVLVAYLVHNFFNYDVIPTGLMFYVLLGMTLVLRRTAGQKSLKPPPEEPEEEPPEEPPKPRKTKSKSKRKRRKKKSKAPTGRARRAAQRLAELRVAESKWRITSLLWGAGGAVLLFMILWGVPSIKDAFSFSIVELKPVAKSMEVKTDILPWILMLAWIGFWTVTLLCGEIFRPGTPEEPDHDDDASMPQHAWFVLGPLLVVLVSLGLWGSSRQISADYHMFRALAYSRAAGRSVIPSVQRAVNQLRQLQQRQIMMRRQGRDDPRLAARFEAQRRRLEHQQRAMQPLLAKLLRKAVYHGRRGAHAINVLGYYHFQYSKVLHPFLKARGMLPGYESIVMESLAHARRSVESNTNPESAWSHLSVVYLAAGSMRPGGGEPLQNAWLETHRSALADYLRQNNLPLAKWALAKSISHDKFYYDTHRMMALLHLQSGHIDRAVKEMNRSLDITEGRHFTQARVEALRVKKAIDKGNLDAADKARQKMWYWLLRSRNFPGMPIMPIKWLVVDDKYAELQAVSRLMARGKVGDARRRLRAAGRKRGSARLPGVDVRFLRGVLAAMTGDSGRAFRILRHIRRPKRPELVIDEVIQMVTTAVRVEMDVNQMIRAAAGSQGDRRRARRSFAQSVERALSDPYMYIKVWGYVIGDLIDNGEMERAKKAGQAAAQFAYLMYSRKRRDHFSPGFRRVYGQVLSARGQVRGAATERGRLSHGQRALARRRFPVALRIADGTLKKFGNKVAMAHFIRGMALAALGRNGAAKQALQTYLKLDPNGKQAAQVKEKLKGL